MLKFARDFNLAVALALSGNMNRVAGVGPDHPNLLSTATLVNPQNSRRLGSFNLQLQLCTDEIARAAALCNVTNIRVDLRTRLFLGGCANYRQDYQQGHTKAGVHADLFLLRVLILVLSSNTTTCATAVFSRLSPSGVFAFNPT